MGFFASGKRQKWSITNRLCFVFCHDLFDNVELCCLRRWSKVKKEGSPGHFFAKDTPTEEPSEEVEQGGLALPTLEGNEYDVICLQAEGYEIDDNNELAPENVPTAIQQHWRHIW
jgi:hypothetical protein